MNWFSEVTFLRSVRKGTEVTKKRIVTWRFPCRKKSVRRLRCTRQKVHYLNVNYVIDYLSEQNRGILLFEIDVWRGVGTVYYIIYGFFIAIVFKACNFFENRWFKKECELFLMTSLNKISYLYAYQFFNARSLFKHSGIHILFTFGARLGFLEKVQFNYFNWKN